MITLLPGEKPFAETAPISGGRIVKVLFAKAKSGKVRLCGWNIHPANLTGDAKAIYSLWRKEIEHQTQPVETLTPEDVNTLKEMLCRHH